MPAFPDAIAFSLNLSGRDIGQLLGKFATDLDIAEDDDSPGPVSKQMEDASKAAYKRLRKNIEAVVGKANADKWEAQVTDLDLDETDKTLDVRHKIPFTLPASDVGILMSKIGASLDDANMYLEEPDGSAMAREILHMYCSVRRGLERELGAGMVGDLQEQIETMWSQATDETVEDIKRMAERNKYRPGP